MWYRRRADNEEGLTLIELLVTMILLAIVSSLMVAAVTQTVRVLTHTDDEARGLNDAKVILDRLGRDVREARGVECDGLESDPTDPTTIDPDCGAHLQLWIDENSDYVRQPTEVVTWRLEKNGQHWDVYRYVGTGENGTPVTRQLQASSLIVEMAFTYFPTSPDDATQVRLDMTYDAIINRGSNPREVSFAARLRNKG